MRKYQLTFLLPPNLKEEEIKKIQEGLNFLIKKEGGVLENSEIIGRKKLAYKIKKEEEAIFCNLEFCLLAEKLEELEKKLKSEKEILRYLILSKGEKREIKMPKPKKIKKEKVEISEIEEKLKEILNES